MSDIYVSALAIYPLKSAAAINCERIEITDSGPRGDRQFMLTKLDGSFVTGRTHPKITSINCEYRGETLVLSHPSCECLTLSVEAFLNEYIETTVWGSNVQAQRCSDEADQWVSSLLGEPLRILYFSKISHRPVVGHASFKVGFADGFPLLLTNEASLDHLNQRLLAAVSMQNFRANIVVSSPIAWSEDGWAKVQIGEVVFDLAKPCGRCIFTTVDPATATLDDDLEPLKTLSSYRQQADGTDVIFGENMLPLNVGIVKLGDRVEVLETKQQPAYEDNWNVEKRRLAQQLTQVSSAKMNNKLLLRCIAVVDETPDVKTFIFICDPLTKGSYLPGQFITIHPQIDAVVHNRCYTLSSSPSKPDTLSITVKRVDNGIVSNFLHDHFAVGSSVQCTAPAGVFHLHSKVAAKIMLLSAGSGITPVLSMLRFIVDTAQSVDVHFHYSAKTESDLICFEEILLMRKRFNRLTLSVNFTVQQYCDFTDIDTGYGRLSTAMIVKFCPDFMHRDVFVCGPDGFMEKAHKSLLSLGLPTKQYAQESFNITTIEPEEEPELCYKVNFSASAIEVNVSANQTILEAAEEAGIYPDYSCMAGVCGSCSSQLMSGDVHAPNAMALDADDLQKGLFLPCCSYARSDLEVDL